MQSALATATSLGVIGLGARFVAIHATTHICTTFHRHLRTETTRHILYWAANYKRWLLVSPASLPTDTLSVPDCLSIRCKNSPSAVRFPGFLWSLLLLRFSLLALPLYGNSRTDIIVFFHKQIAHLLIVFYGALDCLFCLIGCAEILPMDFSFARKPVNFPGIFMGVCLSHHNGILICFCASSMRFLAISK